MERIWLSLAHMSGYEQAYIKEAFDTNWVVPLGPNVNAFEDDISNFLKGKNDSELHVTALSSGTAALHLALILAGIQSGDEVVCQSFTFIASANPVVYLGASPVFVDSETDTWNMDPDLLEQAIEDRIKKTNKVPKAIVVVHLYGMPAKMDRISEIAEKYGIALIEDAAEALGSEYKGQKCGTFGKFAVLSFNGNKIITTSGGGALVSHHKEDSSRAVYLATQAREPAPHYQHTCIGYNYRLSNICAGIGRGQMQVLDQRVSRRRQIHELYKTLLADVEGITVMSNPAESYDSNYWLTCILIDEKVFGRDREHVRLALDADNIESRPLWKPLHLQPVFADAASYCNGTSELLFANGLCLPSGSSLSDSDITRIVETIKKQ